MFLNNLEKNNCLHLRLSNSNGIFMLNFPILVEFVQPIEESGKFCFKNRERLIQPFQNSDNLIVAINVVLGSAQGTKRCRVEARSMLPAEIRLKKSTVLVKEKQQSLKILWFISPPTVKSWM